MFVVVEIYLPHWNHLLINCYIWKSKSLKIANHYHGYHRQLWTAHGKLRTSFGQDPPAAAVVRLTALAISHRNIDAGTSWRSSTLSGKCYACCELLPPNANTSPSARPVSNPVDLDTYIPVYCFRLSINRLVSPEITKDQNRFPIGLLKQNISRLLEWDYFYKPGYWHQRVDEKHGNPPPR